MHINEIQDVYRLMTTKDLIFLASSWAFDETVTDTVGALLLTLCERLETKEKK